MGSRCKGYTLFRQILLIFNQILVCGTSPSDRSTLLTHNRIPLSPTVLLTLRIYALYNRSKPILAYMLISGAILAGIACVRAPLSFPLLRHFAAQTLIGSLVRDVWPSEQSRDAGFWVSYRLGESNVCRTFFLSFFFRRLLYLTSASVFTDSRGY